MRRWGLFLFLVLSSGCATQGQRPEYRLVEPGAPDSAQAVAMRMLRSLADGDLDAAAALSNAPKRRLEVLRDYRNSLGEEEFRQVFQRYFAPQNKVIAEVALGPRRLIVWDLGEADNHVAGQFYIEIDGRFVMDDVPSDARSELRRILQEYRTGKANRERTPAPFSEKGP